MGYHSLVGDMGTILSGGQKQRVLLARALYKRPKILVLDEATSHLDIELEKIVVANIRALRLTQLAVAHRPETVANADRFLVLAGGKIVRGGSLSKKSGSHTPPPPLNTSYVLTSRQPGATGQF